ncbi:MAG: glycosyltransferase family 2 protein [Micrococcaceae bacterium]|nr:glycosyltransferase family 2 protein [Micrococcaceae bacterium]
MSSITVVVPVLNDAEHLAVLLDLLSRQSRVPDEIIIVDNGCIDSSAALARAAGARVIYEPVPGIPAAAAAGYDAAGSEIIVRCDADTRPAPDWLRHIEQHFISSGQVDALTGPGRFYDQPRGLGYVASAFYAGAYFMALGGALARTPLWGSNMAFRRELWPKVRAQLDLGVEGIHDDLDFSCKLEDGTTVLFDRRLRVGAAGRVFSGRGTLRGSIRMAMRTLVHNGSGPGVWNRWRRRLVPLRHQR